MRGRRSRGGRDSQAALSAVKFADLLEGGDNPGFGGSRTLEDWAHGRGGSANRRMPETDWLNGSDTGISSRAMFYVLMGWGNPEARRWPDNWPHDTPDLGRCIRMLDLFPAWRERLGEVATAFPGTPWPSLVEAWDELEALYREDLDSGEGRRCYDRMKAILAEADHG